MITIHHLQNSRSERILWLFEELGLPYELKLYSREPVTRFAPPAYKALHPQGTAPIITDGPIALAETGAIVHYVLQKHGKGRLEVSPDAANFADYVYWLHFPGGSFEPTATLSLVAGSPPGATPETARRLGERVDKAYRLVEDRLGKAPYLAGPDFTAADLMMVYGLTTIRAAAKRSLADYPNIRAYLKRIGERPAFQRAMAKGDPGKPLNLD
jgi:glutathione S-transferase